MYVCVLLGCLLHFPCAALGFNKPDADVMLRPPRSMREPIVNGWLFCRYVHSRSRRYEVGAQQTSVKCCNLVKCCCVVL